MYSCSQTTLTTSHKKAFIEFYISHIDSGNKMACMTMDETYSIQ